MDKRLFAALFFLSGACGLMYEILFTRLFALVLGNTYLSISIIVATFMFGLFFGAWLAGRLLNSKCYSRFFHKNELQLYAYLELLIGGYVILLVIAFGAVESVMGYLFNVAKNPPLLQASVKFILTLVFTLLPTSAMGATLPIVVQYYSRQRDEFHTNISLFYAVNTIGGAAGILMAGFFVIEYLGIREGITLTALINIAIGGYVWFRLRGKAPSLQEASGTTSPEPEAISRKKEKGKEKLPRTTSPGVRFFYPLAAGISGFTALAYEIIWTRGLKFFVLNSTYGFAAMLFVFLVGLAIGGYIARRIRGGQNEREFRYGVYQIGVGIYAIFTIYLLYNLSYSNIFQTYIANVIFDSAYHWVLAIGMFLFISLIIFLLPSVLMGIMFPLINDMFYDAVSSNPGRTVSVIYAINTVGAILGSLGAGFLLLPLLGIKTAVYALSILNFFLGILFLVISGKRLHWQSLVVVPLVAVVIYLSLDGKYLYGRHEKKKDRVLFYREGLMSTVKVYEHNQNRYMSIDGVRIASTGRGLLQKEKLLAHLPFLIKPGIRKVLSVGLASGISTGSMTLHPDVERVDCVELIKPVFDAAHYFSRDNFDIFHNPRVRLIYDDIFSFLKYHEDRYDLISSDGKIGSLNSGNTVLLSEDYYELCKQRLTEDGLFIQWVPLTTPSPVLKSVLQTLYRSFPHIAVFYFYPSDIFMIASQKPFLFDVPYMKRVFRNEAILRDLRPFSVHNPAAVLTAYVGNYEHFFGKTGHINTLNHPILEFMYMRQWKKSRIYPGGYRAKNMDYLVKNYERIDLADYIRENSPWDTERIRMELFSPALSFFKFAVLNFQKGNYFIGLKTYQEFKQSLMETD